MAFGVKRGRGIILASFFWYGAQKRSKELPREANYDSYAALERSDTTFHSILYNPNEKMSCAAAGNRPPSPYERSEECSRRLPRRKSGALSRPLFSA